MALMYDRIGKHLSRILIASIILTSTRSADAQYGSIYTSPLSPSTVSLPGPGMEGCSALFICNTFERLSRIDNGELAFRTPGKRLPGISLGEVDLIQTFARENPDPKSMYNNLARYVANPASRPTVPHSMAELHLARSLEQRFGVKYKLSRDPRAESLYAPHRAKEALQAIADDVSRQQKYARDSGLLAADTFDAAQRKGLLSEDPTGFADGIYLDPKTGREISIVRDVHTTRFYSTRAEEAAGRLYKRKLWGDNSTDIEKGEFTIAGSGEEASRLVQYSRRSFAALNGLAEVGGGMLAAYLLPRDWNDLSGGVYDVWRNGPSVNNSLMVGSAASKLTLDASMIGLGLVRVGSATGRISIEAAKSMSRMLGNTLAVAAIAYSAFELARWFRGELSDQQVVPAVLTLGGAGVGCVIGAAVTVESGPGMIFGCAGGAVVGSLWGGLAGMVVSVGLLTREYVNNHALHDYALQNARTYYQGIVNSRLDDPSLVLLRPRKQRRS
jgi:hypothetical protein